MTMFDYSVPPIEGLAATVAAGVMMAAAQMLRTAAGGAGCCGGPQGCSDSCCSGWGDPSFLFVTGLALFLFGGFVEQWAIYASSRDYAKLENNWESKIINVDQGSIDGGGGGGTYPSPSYRRDDDDAVLAHDLTDIDGYAAAHVIM